jgi:hypothetical protein
MIISGAEWIARSLELYAAAGVIFAVPFAAWGAAAIDPAAQSSGLGFRLMILPGAALLWPLLAIKWVRR